MRSFMGLSGFFPRLIGVAMCAWYIGAAQAAQPVPAAEDGRFMVDDLVNRSERLARQAEPGRSHLSDTQALVRYEDHLFQHMIGQHKAAAEGFFSLVASNALTDAGLYRDAEWYLAESLLEMGNVVTAEARFKAIADDAKHPFREDAVRRLLELYAREGATSKFEAVYQSEIVSGKVAASPMVTYSVGKSFYHQGQFDQARRYFEQVPEGTSWRHRSRYMLGTMDVVEGKLDTARAQFDLVVALPVNTLEERLVHDLGLLAIGRIAYHSNDFAGAAEAYASVSGDSAYHADKLYELVWSFIKQERWDDASRSVEIFLLAFPEHQYTAQLKVIEGHLHMAQEGYDEALTSYEGIVRDYGPIRDRFAELSSSTSEPTEYFNGVLNMDDGTSVDAAIPAYALAMMRNDPDLSQAIEIYRTLDAERKDVELSESIVAELRVLMSDAGGGPYAELRKEALLTGVSVMRRQLSLMAAEEALLSVRGDHSAAIADSVSRRQAIEVLVGEVEAKVEQIDSAARARLERLDVVRRELTELTSSSEAARRRQGELEALLGARIRDERMRLEAETELAQVEGTLASADQRRGDLEAELSGLSAPALGDEADVYARAAKLTSDAVSALRSSRGGNDSDWDSFDAQHARLGYAHEKLAFVIAKAPELQATEGVKLKERFQVEVAEVAAERADLDATRVSAEQLSVALTREGFGRMEDFFADSILKADLGIVNVYWAQKVEVSDQLREVRVQRNELVTDLDDRFRIIRQKIGQK